MAQFELPVSEVNWSMIDNSAQNASIGFWVEKLLPDGSNAGAVNTAVDGLKSAVIAASLLNINRERLTSRITTDLAVTPSNVNAQRGIKLTVLMIDTVNNNKSKRTLPGVNLGLFAEEGTTNVDLEEPGPAAFKLAIDTWAKSDDGNPVEVYAMQITSV